MSGAITGAITGGMQGAASFMKSSKLMGSLDEASHFSKKVKAPKGCPKDCFAAGTMVKTEQGYKAIEEIEIGDKVWSWDEENGEQALKTVVQLFRNTKTVKTKVRIESEDGTIDEIVSTPRHKYYLPLNRANRNPKEELEHTSYEGLTEQWVSARDLKAGDRVVLAQTEGLTEGVKYGIVKAVKTEESESYTTYNLEVEDYIPIFWGKTSVCVHNAGCESHQSWSTIRKNYWKKQADLYKGASGRSASNTYDITTDNLSRMVKGRAPIGTDGYSVHLHHRVGKAVDINDFYEITRTANYPNFKSLHPWLFPRK